MSNPLANRFRDFANSHDNGTGGPIVSYSVTPFPGAPKEDHYLTADDLRLAADALDATDPSGADALAQRQMDSFDDLRGMEKDLGVARDETL